MANKLDRCYIPPWLLDVFETSRTRQTGQSRPSLFSQASKVYGKMSISDRELFGQYIDDLVEEEVLTPEGNWLVFTPN